MIDNKYKKEVFLGITNDNKLAFADIEISKNYNNSNILSISFDTDSILNKTKYIESGEYKSDLESYVDYLDEKTKLILLEQFDCSPSELSYNLYDEETLEGSPYWDNSTYTDEVEVGDDTYIFPGASGGQLDLREEGMKENLDENLYNMINDYWDKYHLKTIPENEEQNLINMVENSLKNGKTFEKYSSDLQDYLSDFISKEKEQDKEVDL